MSDQIMMSLELLEERSKVEEDCLKHQALMDDEFGEYYMNVMSRL
jgi:hypothetical protein